MVAEAPQPQPQGDDPQPKSVLWKMEGNLQVGYESAYGEPEKLFPGCRMLVHAPSGALVTGLGWWGDNNPEMMARRAAMVLTPGEFARIQAFAEFMQSPQCPATYREFPPDALAI